MTETFEPNYRIYYKKKPNGKHRKICAPSEETKSMQRETIFAYMEALGQPHKAAHGFIEGKSNKTNAKVHLGAEAIYNIDLKDFFDSITKEMLADYIRSNHNIDQSLIDRLDLFVLPEEEHLPQGAPTSPYLTNIYCRPLDKKLYTLCKRHGLKYTRYADDLTFSGNFDTLMSIRPSIRELIGRYNLTINKTKEAVFHKTNRKYVTGINVYENLSIGRKQYNKYRADVHRTTKALREGRINKDNYEEVLGEDIERFEARVSYLVSVNPKLTKLKTDTRSLYKMIKES